MNYYLLSACFTSKSKNQLKEFEEFEESLHSFRKLSSRLYKEVEICTNSNALEKFKIKKEFFTNTTKLTKKVLSLKSLNYPEHWLKSGCWRWKPHLILNSLSKLDDGDILVYHDINILKYPEYSLNISMSPERFKDLLGNKSILIFSPGYKPISSDVKAYFLKKFDLLNNMRFLLPGFWSGCIVFRKDINSCDFVKNWAYNATVDNYYPIPELEPKLRFSNFVHHSSCQAGLAKVYYKSKKLRPHISVAYIDSNRLIASAVTNVFSSLFLISKLLYVKSLIRHLILSSLKFFRKIL